MVSEVKFKMKTKPELVWPVVFLRALDAMEPKEKTLKIHHQEIVDNHVIATL